MSFSFDFSVFSGAFFDASIIVYAIVVGVLTSLLASVLGVNMVLKRYSMIGDGLSHVGFGALSMAVVLNVSPMGFSVPVIIIAALFLLRLNKKGALKAESAIALLSVSCLSIGVLLNSLGGGSNIDINSYLFGSIVSVKSEYLFISVSLFVLVLLFFLVFQNLLL